MKKARLLATLALVALLSVPLAGTALAQEPTPPQATYAQGPFCGGYGAGPGFGVGPGGASLSRIASLLGTTTQELLGELRQGKTVLEVAQAKGVGEAQLVEAILKPYRDQLRRQVERGYLTEEQSDWLLEQAQERLSYSLTVPGAYGAYGFRGGGGLRGPRGFGGWGSGGMMGGWGFGPGMMGRWGFGW